MEIDSWIKQINCSTPSEKSVSKNEGKCVEDCGESTNVVDLETETEKQSEAEMEMLRVS